MSSSEELEVFFQSDYSSMSSVPSVSSATSSDSSGPAHGWLFIDDSGCSSSPSAAILSRIKGESQNESHSFHEAIGKNLLWEDTYLGEGSFGKVIKVTHLTDKCEYAVKLMLCIPGKREKYQERELKLLTAQVKSPMTHKNLLYEYRDLFIDMDVRNNRSELAIANRHQER